MLSVEDLLRQLIATLRETGELENTYVSFTSDNGYHLGNHRFGAHKKTPYEEDIGVPLMVRGPGVPAGAVRQQLVLNNDFAPTLAGLAGVPAPAFVDGRSFAPLLTGAPPSSWRQAFLEEGWLWNGTAVPTPTHKGVHTQGRMLVEYDTGEQELYDLAADPYQLESMPRAGNGCSTPPSRPASTTSGTARPALATPPSGPPTPPLPGSRARPRGPTPQGSPPRPTPRPTSRRA